MRGGVGVGVDVGEGEGEGEGQGPGVGVAGDEGVPGGSQDQLQKTERIWVELSLQCIAMQC